MPSAIEALAQRAHTPQGEAGMPQRAGTRVQILSDEKPYVGPQHRTEVAGRLAELAANPDVSTVTPEMVRYLVDRSLLPEWILNQVIEEEERMGGPLIPSAFEGNTVYRALTELHRQRRAQAQREQLVHESRQMFMRSNRGRITFGMVGSAFGSVLRAFKPRGSNSYIYSGWR